MVVTHRGTPWRSDREKSRGSPLYGSANHSLAACYSGSPRIAMSSTKPLDVVVLPESRGRNPDNRREPYREYKEKSEASSNNWSCYILAKEAEVSAIILVTVPRLCVFQPRCFRFDAQIRRRSSSWSRSPSTRVVFNSISSVRKVNREIL